MFCSNCGAELLNDVNFCPNCGNSFASKKTNFNINPKSSKLVIICAFGILAAFFMPWIKAIGAGISGYNLGQFGSYGNYVWIIPILSGATILLSIFNINNRVIGAFTGIIPLIALVYLIIRVDNASGFGVTKNFIRNSLDVFSIGFYLTIIFSFAIIIAALLKNNEGKNPIMLNKIFIGIIGNPEIQGIKTLTILAILSIILSWFPLSIIISIIFACIAIIKGKKLKKDYNTKSDKYKIETAISIRNIIILGRIGLTLASLAIIVWTIFLISKA